MLDQLCQYITGTTFKDMEKSTKASEVSVPMSNLAYQMAVEYAHRHGATLQQVIDIQKN